MDLRREHIYAGFSVLLDSGFRAPFEPKQMNQVVNTWYHMLKGEMTKEVWESSIGAYVRSPEANTFWPTISQIAAQLRKNRPLVSGAIEWHKIRRMVLALPAYTGSSLSKKQIDREWQRQIKRHYPNGLPSSVEQALEALGGRTGIKRALGREDNGYTIRAAERSFVSMVKEQEAAQMNQIANQTRHQIAGGE
jgi:hypothetical protein